MVNVIVKNDNKILQISVSKKVFCFGAGKKFHEFLYKHPNVCINGVIDNYRGGKNNQLIVYNKAYPIISLNEYKERYAKDALLIITVKDYEKIVEQLDADDGLNGMECYLFVMPEEPGYELLLEWVRKHNLGELGDIYFEERNRHDIVKRFQIWNSSSDGVDAGSKAPKDVMNIAGWNGYQRIDIHPWVGEDITSAISWTVERNKQDWERCFDKIIDGSILLLQHPFQQDQHIREYMLKSLKRDRHVKIVSLIHDVEELRKAYYTEFMKHEFQFMLEIADAYIVHNNRMKQYFMNKGIHSSKIFVLELFDYLFDGEKKLNVFDNSVTIAGNLDSSKGEFIEHLGEIENIKFHLFGSGYDKHFQKNNIIYHGAFPMEKILSALQGGYGLIWNGDSLDTCDGDMGYYLRYNNPHKLSLYMAAGMPVIVWDKSAGAEFVKKYGVGITIESLWELPKILNSITETEYNGYLKNIEKVSRFVRDGIFTKKALRNAEGYVLKCGMM